MATIAVLDLQLKTDSLETAHQVIHATLTDTRAFPGCLGVTVLIDSDDPAHVVVYETWESIEHDRAYRAWRATPKVPRISAPSWPHVSLPNSRSPKAFRLGEPGLAPLHMPYQQEAPRQTAGAATRARPRPAIGRCAQTYPAAPPYGTDAPAGQLVR